MDSKKKFPNLPDATIIIGRSTSACNNCGRAVLASEKKHDVVSGYVEPESPGCGIEFTHVTTDYIGSTVTRVVKELRPDLEFISPWTV